MNTRSKQIWINSDDVNVMPNTVALCPFSFYSEEHVCTRTRVAIHGMNRLSTPLYSRAAMVVILAWLFGGFPRPSEKGLIGRDVEM